MKIAIRTCLFILSCLSPGACSFLPTSGPSGEVIKSEGAVLARIQVVDVDESVARRLLTKQRQYLFSETLSDEKIGARYIGPGDIIEISIWEAPPATLFSSIGTESRLSASATRVTALPEQMVSSDGSINVPFAGHIKAANKTLQEIEVEIANSLKDKANQPQVLVRLIRNATANVTVVGEVVTSTRMPLSPMGERLLDALAAAGGVKQPVNKMTLQITRGEKVQALPLDFIIRDPKQNILLQPGDVITALHQPLSFTALGASGKNDEINFEAQGITLAQALARVGGLNDTRADAQGLFIFRFEAADALDWSVKPLSTTPEGKVPVIYRVDLKDPRSFFVAQSFLIENRDIVYIANAPAAEFQKFLNLAVSIVYPVVNITTVVR